MTNAPLPTPGVIVPVQITRPDTVAPFATLVRDTDARRLWTGQGFATDAHQVFAHLAGRGLAVPTGISVGLMALRHPFEAALQARTLSVVTGFPVVAGYGPGEPEFVEALGGTRYPAPVSFSRRYAQEVRSLLHGEPAPADGGHRAGRARLPAFDHPMPEVGLGVLRPAMARAAGAVADVAITWLTPPPYVARTIVPALEAGAAGRRTPAPGPGSDGRPTVPRIVTVVPVALAGKGRDPEVLAFHAARHHMSVPHYADMLRRAGVALDPADPRASSRALIESGAFVTGDADQVVRALERYRDAGVDEVVLNPAGVLATEGLPAAVRDVEEILAAVASRNRVAGRSGEEAKTRG
ncbi:LLM class flavin-dependent oxidoreductase [Streptomyces sp. NRRL S-920]|uniref:LLM class flavin-dependent oxidoreductase n=1 Tax=Streptomyces sp. NRRL S-920 TaxID=1463921 RepID=UPI0004CB887E|nr:LLM class flavin-dependent oxidoreductase [Streptomyces sp. NRRL S-920]